MTDRESGCFDESILLSFPFMHWLFHAAFEGEPGRVTKTQFNILVNLYSYGELTMMQLSRLTGISKEQTTRALSPLADSGLVTRHISEDNRNYVYVSLTPEGRSRMQALLRRCTSRLNKLADERMPPDELKELGEHLTAVRLLIRKLISR